MVEQYEGKRIKFKNIATQREYLGKLFKGITIHDASKICTCSERTLRDWKRGKFLPDATCIKKLCEESMVPFPKNITLIKYTEQLRKNGRLGGIATIKKYGKVPVDESKRLKRWKKWWNTSGKYNPNIVSNKTLPFRKVTQSEKLAEFFGIVLGDGSVTRRQISITLNLEDDKRYIQFVYHLCINLFKVIPSKQERKYQNTMNIIISRVRLVEYLVNEYDLFIGHKVIQQVDVPDWIKNNKKYSLACVRGLIDTDGSIYTHRYKSGNKNNIYSYKKICFTNASLPLRVFVYDTLNALGIIAKYSGGDNVRVESQASVKKYMKVINTNNSKHLENYIK